eukprot:TRINITY_DN12195_c0_g4_i2.p1 TRINITY_DN12195_c0_g4~~TRINITY_DN12195_c0_g4_i2.p1  ORF type:complete len:318 (+),score=42.59 TRINITY_DN12195_c0_g4_i2:52-1005(+)
MSSVWRLPTSSVDATTPDSSEHNLEHQLPCLIDDLQTFDATEAELIYLTCSDEYVTCIRKATLPWPVLASNILKFNKKMINLHELTCQYYSGHSSPFYGVLQTLKILCAGATQSSKFQLSLEPNRTHYVESFPMSQQKKATAAWLIEAIIAALSKKSQLTIRLSFYLGETPSPSLVASLHNALIGLLMRRNSARDQLILEFFTADAFTALQHQCFTGPRSIKFQLMMYAETKEIMTLLAQLPSEIKFQDQVCAVTLAVKLACLQMPEVVLEKALLPAVMNVQRDWFRTQYRGCFRLYARARALRCQNSKMLPSMMCT